jgi:hypothetical protein
MVLAVGRQCDSEKIESPSCTQALDHSGAVAACFGQMTTHGFHGMYWQVPTGASRRSEGLTGRIDWGLGRLAVGFSFAVILAWIGVYGSPKIRFKEYGLFRRRRNVARQKISKLHSIQKAECGALAGLTTGYSVDQRQGNHSRPAFA